jgi:hypothetical protein
VEVLVITVWFYALVIIGGAFVASLMVRAVRADDRYLATYEPTRQAEVERQPPEALPLAA